MARAAILGPKLSGIRRLYLRKQKANILALGVVALLGFLMLFMFGNQILWSFLQHQRYQQALEAAALKAASDLSEIVINDPYFGFVSLSDRPAIGRATKAADGQSVPVHSINTIIAAARLDYIVARELGNAQMEQFALEDARRARDTAVQLNKTLTQALTQNPKATLHDMDGNVIKPYADALKVYTTSLSCFSKASPKEFTLNLGWLKDSGASVTPVPVSKANLSRPRKDKYVPAGGEVKGFYRAGIDIPVANEHFTFASLGAQPSLVRTENFVPTDANHVSSIVRVQSLCDAPSLLPWDKSSHLVNGRACAEAYSLTSQPAPSVLVVAFPDGRPDGVNCLRDLILCRGLNLATMKTYRPIKGDFPIDAEAELEPLDDSLADCTAGSAVARSFYDWLRSNYALPKIDALLEALDQPLHNLGSAASSGSSIFALEVTAGGDTVITCLRRNPFEDLRIAEGQLYAISNQPAPIGSHSWTVVCRDEVFITGTTNGGMHAGQPMAGNPINWAELSTYVDERFASAAATRRPAGVSISGEQLPGGGIDLTGAKLKLNNAQAAGHDIRTSACSAGLAAEIRVSSPMSH